MAELGKSTRGTPVRLRKDILDCSLLITFGAISHHYFAGYGGGRKLLFPGLAEKKAIYANHSLFLDRDKKQLAFGCQPGQTENNPVAQDLKEIDAMLPDRISIHAILNTKGKVVQLHIGKSYDEFIAVCNIHDSYYRQKTAKSYNLVVASTGGYPKDVNFIQAHKSLHHAAAFVKERGQLILLSECRDGVGSEHFLEWFDAGSFGNAFTKLEKHFLGNGGTALSLMAKTQRIKINLLTSLDQELCRRLGLAKLEVSDLQKLIDDEKGTIGIIPNASLLIRGI
jgi:nickel-dependent lactate racemase